MRDLYQPRKHFKPFEYSECEAFVDAINESYWTHKEFNFTTDIQQYHTELNNYQRSVAKKCLLSVSQVEVSVKPFWGQLHIHLPKPEINAMGATFAESEVRHERAYSFLLEKLGLNDEFEKIYDIPAIIDRHVYLTKYKEFAHARLKENFVKSIILFSLFIENVSLFSQFYILQSFNKHRKWLTDISNVVAATSKEEAVHAQAGMWLVNELREEHPEFFNEELEKLIYLYAGKAFRAEEKTLKWIMDEGDLEFAAMGAGKPDHVKVLEVKDFTKNRLNDSLIGIGLNPIFDVNEKRLERTKWFDEKLIAGAHVDFFNQRSVGYSRKNKSITENDLF